MRGQRAGHVQEQEPSQGGCHPRHQQPRSGPRAPRGLLLLLLASWVIPGQGAPMASHVLREQDLRLQNEIDDVCSAYLAKDTQPQASSALEELCFMVLGLLQKTQVYDKKDSTKRFLFHYSKTHDTGNSNTLSSVLHPLLELVPHLHEKRLKRHNTDEELQTRRYFAFRPRNGRRSSTFR